MYKFLCKQLKKNNRILIPLTLEKKSHLQPHFEGTQYYDDRKHFRGY